MNARLILYSSLILSAALVNGCLHRDYESKIIKSVSTGQDPAALSQVAKASHLSMEQVINTLWYFFENGSIEEKHSADLALAHISRGVLLSPGDFSLSKVDYWKKMTDLFSSKHSSSSGANVKRASAIYLRQIRTPYSESISESLNIPSLKELTGIELRPDAL